MAIYDTNNLNRITTEAGGLCDNSHNNINHRINGCEDGVLKFGMGVVGTEEGTQIKLPESGATIETFEGITVNCCTERKDKIGKDALKKNATVGVLTNGQVCVRIKEDVIPACGDNLYLITEGEYAGIFTNKAENGAIAINGTFIGIKSADDTAPVMIVG